MTSPVWTSATANRMDTHINLSFTAMAISVSTFVGQRGELLTVVVHFLHFLSRIHNCKLTPNPVLILTPPLNLK